MTSNFNIDIWEDLLQQSKNINNLPSHRKIKDTYNLSDRTAYAYSFALKNRFQLTTSFEESKIRKALQSRIAALVRSDKKLNEEIKHLEDKLNFMAALESQPTTSQEPINVIDNPQFDDEITYLGLLSDVHIEEVVDPATINNLNEYSPEICEHRLELFFKRTLWMVKSLRKAGYNIKHMVLAILGDMITGYIHEELQESNAMSPTEASLMVQSLLERGIMSLSENGDFESIKVILKYGNHGRTTKRKRYSTAYKNSYEWMMYQQIKANFTRITGYDNVEIIVENGEFTTATIYDKTVCFSHGDHFRYQGGIGGIMVPFNRWVTKMQSVLPADKYYIGHWHTHFGIPGGVVNGSVIGYNAFAMGIAAKPEVPQQHFELIDSKRGFTLGGPLVLTDW